uniref:Replication factor C subunit 3 n=1 Tax=Glossina pallidipes TaxID=7398 RepID=A0A1A9Z1Z1_GLOPL
MALWVDKHRPRELSRLDYHKNQAENLRNLCQQGDFPHLLFYGPSGAGKKTRIMCLLRELYGAGVERLRNEIMTFTTSSNRKISVMTIGSNYHLEVNPSDAGIHDRVVIIDLIKQVAQVHQIDPNGQREFKIIVLSEVDELTKDAQHALRRTMEKYVATCRIILSVNSTSRIIPAIRSRCLGIRVGAPRPDEMATILQNISKKEGVVLPSDLAKRIVQKSERNLRLAILMLETCKVQQYPFTVQQEIVGLDWKTYLRETANQIISEQTPAKLEKIRDRLYELLAQGVPPDVIFQGLAKDLVCNSDMSIKAKVLEYASLYEHRMQNGSKYIFHLEAFVAHFMNIYKKFLADSMIMDEF